MKNWIPTLMISILIASCASVDKMIDTGNFDRAALLSAKRLAGKSNLKDKYVIALEESFEKATARDMRQMQVLDNSAHSSDWARVLVILDRIDRRQEAIHPLLPLKSKKGYEARFTFVRTGALRNRAVEQYVALTYKEVEALLVSARHGDKFDARLAHRKIDNIWKYRENYALAKEWQVEARALGTTRVEVRVENRLYRPIPEYLQDAMVKDAFRNEKWIKYYRQGEAPKVVDYLVEVQLNDLQYSPERISEQLYADAKEIQTGFEYVLDEDGNVLKDSLGNDVKTPIFQLIEAEVLRVQQSKYAELVGAVTIKNLRQNQYEEFPIRSEMAFEHIGATYRGDSRALRPESKNWLGSSPLPFPSNEVMFDDVMEGMGKVIRKEVKRFVS